MRSIQNQLNNSTKQSKLKYYQKSLNKLSDPITKPKTYW